MLAIAHFLMFWEDIYQYFCFIMNQNGCPKPNMKYVFLTEDGQLLVRYTFEYGSSMQEWKSL